MKTLSFAQTICFALMLISYGAAVGTAQHFDKGLAQQTFVDADVKQIEVVVGATQRLRFGYKIPELLVENPEVVKATPVSPNEILISGLKPGLTTITVTDTERNLQTVSIHVTADTRKLEAALQKHFPESRIQVHALQTGVMLKGTVARADHVNTMVSIAQDYFPTNVINQLQVDGSQVVAINVKIYEVNRSKFRTLGIDWTILGDDFGVVSSVADVIGDVGITAGTAVSSGSDTFAFGVFGGDTSFFTFMEALEQHNLARLLDQPTLVAQNGRPAEFLSGGEIPIAVASGLGTTSIEFRPFGTKLDIVPLIHGQGEITLEVRAEVSAVDGTLSFGSGVPGFRVRRVNTGVRMKEGHTLALAGDYQESSETAKRGIPFLMDSPIWGSLFRRVEDTQLETELVFMITPRFISEVDPTEVPRLGPGQLTESPSNNELYGRGYVEVPRCTDDCPTRNRFDDPASQNSPSYHDGFAPQQQGGQVIPQGGQFDGGYGQHEGAYEVQEFGGSSSRNVPTQSYQPQYPESYDAIRSQYDLQNQQFNSQSVLPSQPAGQFPVQQSAPPVPQGSGTSQRGGFGWPLIRGG